MVKGKSNYLPWVIIIVLILIILYMVYNGFKTKIDAPLSDTSPPDTSPSNIVQLTDKCTETYRDCMEIARTKGYIIDLINKDSLNNFNEANTFYRHWRGSQQSSYLILELDKTGENLSYPATMFVVESKYGTSAPLNTKVIICNSDGTLLKVTSSWACGE